MKRRYRCIEQEKAWIRLRVFGTGAGNMSAIEGPTAYTAVMGGRLVTSRKAMRFMAAPVTIWEKSETAIA